MREALGTGRRRAFTLGAWALFVFAPFLTLGCVSLLLGRDVLNTLPVWSDEADYWRSLYSWASVGMDSGAYGMYDMRAPVGSLSVHGLAPILIYGGFVRIFGCTTSAIMLCNALWASAGALCFCLVLRPSAKTALALTALWLLYEPLLIYAPTSMTEVFNYALALFYLAFLLDYARRRKPLSLALCAVVVIFATFYRISYFVAFLPLLWLWANRKPGKRLLLGALTALLVSAGLFWLSELLTSPFQDGFLYHLQRSEDLLSFLRRLKNHALDNLRFYFCMPAGTDIEGAFRWLYAGWMALALLCAFLRPQRRGGRLRVVSRVDEGWLGCFLMLFLPFAIVIVLYEIYSFCDYRTLAPFLWATAAYAAWRGRRAAVAAFALCCALSLALTCAPAQLHAFLEPARFEAPAESQAVAAIADAVVYDPDATGAFDNSLRAPRFSFALLRALDPRIGTQMGAISDDLPARSRYLLLPSHEPAPPAYTLILSTDEGVLYRRDEDGDEGDAGAPPQTPAEG